MDQLQFSYEPNKGYGSHHRAVRNKVSAIFKKSYDDLNDTIKMLMNACKKIQTGQQGYLRDKETQKEIIRLCGGINQCFRDMKADHESNILNEKKYLASLNTLCVMINTFPNLNKYG